MGVWTYAGLLLGISIVMFLGTGYNSPLYELFGCSGMSTCSISSNIGEIFLNVMKYTLTHIDSLIVVVGAGFLVNLFTGGGFALIYLYPYIIFGMLSTYLFPATSFMVLQGLPSPFNLLLYGFMMILLLLTMVSFIRGGE